VTPVETATPAEPAEAATPAVTPPTIRAAAALTAAAISAAAVRGSRTAAVHLRQPMGRLALAGALIVVLIGGTAAAGATVVPALADPIKVVAQPSPSEPAVIVPGSEPSPSLGPSASSPPTAAARPADQFASWAGQIAPKVDIPPVALQAYAYAEWVTSQTRPACKLQWTTLAAIGKVESDHGRGNGATLDQRGRSTPPIMGLPLDGTGGRKKITDTDAGAFDNDKKWDHAVGAMQFLPSTWTAFAVDADADQLADPFDLDDASLAAAYFLCASGRDMSVVANWKAVVLTYNNVGVYLEKVYDTAQLYGQRSRA
jgi:membrane-bound lytic murein transglycosylase B